MQEVNCEENGRVRLLDMGKTTVRGVGWRERGEGWRKAEGVLS
jgi:hypothetical protein